jgi:hypothetical protein
MIRAIRAYEQVEENKKKLHIFSVVADKDGFEYIFPTDKIKFDSSERVDFVMSKIRVDKTFLNAQNYINLSQMKFDDYIFGPSFGTETLEMAVKGERICLDFGDPTSVGEPTASDVALSAKRVAAIYTEFPELTDYYNGVKADPKIVKEAMFRVKMATVGMTNPQFAYDSLAEEPALESPKPVIKISSSHPKVADEGQSDEVQLDEMQSDIEMETPERLQLSSIPDDLRLAIALSHCDEVTPAMKNIRHPCHLVTNSQSPIDPSERQLSDPWTGAIATGRVLFVSPNPGINEDPTKKREDFPTKSWSPQRAGEFFIRRFDQTRDPIISTFKHPTKPDFLTRSLDGRYRGGVRGSHRQQKTLRDVYERAVELLGSDADPQLDYALTEIVHCKSARAFGVPQAATHCLNKWMDRTLEISPANLIVVLGAKSRDWFAVKWLINAPIGFGSSAGYEALGKIGRAKRDIFVENCGGRDRVVIFNAHPTVKGLHLLKDVYGEKVLRLLKEFADGSIEVPGSTQSLHNMLETVSKTAKAAKPKK